MWLMTLKVLSDLLVRGLLSLMSWIRSLVLLTLWKHRIACASRQRLGRGWNSAEWTHCLRATLKLWARVCHPFSFPLSFLFQNTVLLSTVFTEY